MPSRLAIDCTNRYVGPKRCLISCFDSIGNIRLSPWPPLIMTYFLEAHLPHDPSWQEICFPLRSVALVSQCSWSEVLRRHSVCSCTRWVCALGPCASTVQCNIMTYLALTTKRKTYHDNMRLGGMDHWSQAELGCFGDVDCDFMHYSVHRNGARTVKWSLHHRLRMVGPGAHCVPSYLERGVHTKGVGVNVLPYSAPSL